MEEWDKTFFAVLESATVELENFWQNMNQMIDEAIEEVSEISEEVMDIFKIVNEEIVLPLLDDIEEAVLDVNQFFDESELEDRNSNNEENELDINDILDQNDLIITYHDFDDNWADNPKIYPLLEKLQVCRGCRNFHGHYYGQNLLVCAIHPSGCDYEKCPDWEAMESQNK